MTEEAYPKGRTVFAAGDPPTQVHLMRSGAVELSSEVRGRRVDLGILRVGDIFGDVALLTGTNQPYDAVTLEPSVVLSIDSVVLCRRVAKNPALAHRWIMSLSNRVAAMEDRLADALAGDVATHVVSILLHEGGDDGVRLSQAVLARCVGAHRTNVNRILKRLEALGLVQLGYGRVDVLDAERLARLSSTPHGCGGTWSRSANRLGSVTDPMIELREICDGVEAAKSGAAGYERHRSTLSTPLKHQPRVA